MDACLQVNAGIAMASAKSRLLADAREISLQQAWAATTASIEGNRVYREDAISEVAISGHNPYTQRSPYNTRGRRRVAERRDGPSRGDRGYSISPSVSASISASISPFSRGGRGAAPGGILDLPPLYDLESTAALRPPPPLKVRMAHRLLVANAGPLRSYAGVAGGAIGAVLEGDGGKGAGMGSGSVGGGSMGGITGGIMGDAMGEGGGGMFGMVNSSSLPCIMSAEQLAQAQQKLASSNLESSNLASSNLASSMSAASLASSAAGLARVWAARTPTRRLAPAHSVASMRMCAPRSFGGQAERFYETHGRTPFTHMW